MSVVITEYGERKLLNLMLKEPTTANQKFTIHLFKNDITPTDTTVVGDFTEADFTNYAAVDLLRANWNNAITDSGSGKSVYNSAITWTAGTTGNTIYGSYVLDVSGNLIFSRRFSSPRTMNNTNTLTITPELLFTGI